MSYMNYMNYMWELLIEVVRQGLKPEDIHYAARNGRISPYVELYAPDLYQRELTADLISNVDVNPYIRFPGMFDKLLGIEDAAYSEFIERLTDVILHSLSYTDVQSVMSKREFYIKFVMSDIDNGAFGDTETVKLFTVSEKRIIANELLTLYKSADYLSSLDSAVKSIFSYCMILERDGREIIFYFAKAKDAETDAKIRFVIKLFLPVSINYDIHWAQTYGIIGHEDFMELGKFIV